MKRIYVILLLSIFLFSCSGENPSPESIESKLKKAMKKADIKFGGICHMEVVSDGILVFYRNQHGLNACFLRDSFSGWKWVTGGGYVSVSPEEGVSWHVSQHIPLCFSYGVITNPDITRIFTRFIDSDKTEAAKIVTTEDGLRIWFVIHQSREQKPVVIIGKSASGEILYEDH